MKRNIFTLLLIFLSFSLGITKGFADIHHIVVASDRHGNTTDMGTSSPIYTAMHGIYSDVNAAGGTVDYVCLDGDMVGSGGSAAPTFNSNIILSEVKNAFSDTNSALFTSNNVSIVYGSHDAGCNDKAAILKCKDYSGQIYEGKNIDGSVAYYIYGISYDSMIDNEDDYQSSFKSWVDGIDPSIPIIVICHVPMHSSRGDNKGGLTWNKLINYAATGEETTESGKTIIRNVFFLHGHNHTNEGNKEYYIPAGSSLYVQDSSSPVSSTIYYTYTTAGYLKANKTATLISIDNRNITLTKYKNGSPDASVYTKDAIAQKQGGGRVSTVGNGKLFTENAESGNSTHTIARILPRVDLTDQASVTTNVGKTVNATLDNRTLYTDGYWNTLCLPFDLNSFANTPLEGAKVKELTAAQYTSDNGELSLTFSDVTTIEAGKPYIVKWNDMNNTIADIPSPFFPGVTISNNLTTFTSEDEYLTFTGIFDPKSFAEDDRSVLYLGSYDRLYWPGAGVNIGAFRAYFQLNNGLTVNPNIQDGNNPNLTNGQQSIRSFSLNFNDNESTGIIEIVNDEKAETGWYTLDGRKLMERPAQKGMYIMNGKKVVIQ